MQESQKSRCGCLISVLGLLIFFIPAFFLSGERTTAAYVWLCIFGIYLMLTIGVRIWLPASCWVPCISFFVLLVFGTLYYRFNTAEGILASYGVHFNPDAVNYESNSLNRIKFWYVGSNKKLVGPEWTDDLIYVEKPFRTKEGTVEFFVRSRAYHSSHFVRIRLILPPVGDKAFEIVEASMVKPLYPLQKGMDGAP